MPEWRGHILHYATSGRVTRDLNQAHCVWGVWQRPRTAVPASRDTWSRTNGRPVCVAITSPRFASAQNIFSSTHFSSLKLSRSCHIQFEIGPVLTLFLMFEQLKAYTSEMIWVTMGKTKSLQISSPGRPAMSCKWFDIYIDQALKIMNSQEIGSGTSSCKSQIRKYLMQGKGLRTDTVFPWSVFCEKPASRPFHKCGILLSNNGYII